MNWGLAGLLYAALYALIVARLPDDRLRLVLGNIALLVPPLVPVAVIAWRRRSWTGRQHLFWITIATGAALWFGGQVVWAIEEVGRSHQLPWFRWFIVVQLCGSALPLIALVALPHRGPRSDIAPTTTIDVWALGCLTAFLYWTLVIAPGMSPDRSELALQTLAIVGPLVRLAAAVGLLAAAYAARGTPWAETYRRIAIGMVIAFGFLIGLSMLAVHGNYRTGSATGVGWMLPFWFSAWAAATAPASTAESSVTIARARRVSQPRVLFVALALVPIVGYGVRLLVPLGDALDDYRDIVTGSTVVAGLAFVMMRFRVEQRAVDAANERARLLATACEQSSELIAIARGLAIVYANDAFCRATGYSRAELEGVAPLQLVSSESIPATAPAVERLERREPVSVTLMLARKDGTTFHAACAIAPLVAPDGTVTHFVAVVHDLSDELALRDQLVKSERLSAIGQLVSGVAHEINNPLQSVIGRLDVVLADLAPGTVRGDLEAIKEETSRAVKIVRNLIAFVRKGPRDRILDDLNDIVRTTVRLRAYELEQAGIELIESYSESLPLVAVNRDEIQQIVMNLMLHAENGVAGRAQARISIRTLLSGKEAVVEVSDNGSRVPPSAAGRVFEPFVATRENGHVAGLGLSIAFNIASAHGGSLEFVPTPEAACFRLRLPGAGFPGPQLVAGSR